MVSAVFFVAAIANRPPEPVLIDGRLRHPAQLIVRNVNGAKLSNALGKEGTIRTSYPQIGCVVVSTQPRLLRTLKTRLSQTFGADKVSYDEVSQPAYTPNDAMFPGMWHALAIKADLAWDLTFGSNAATVAIMDTGVNLAHADLAGNAWVNTLEVPGNGVDDDSNGFVDDVNGYDFAYGDPTPDDVHGHGTACAGLAAATMDNGVGGVGVGSRAKIMALKAATNDGYFYASANIGCYLYAADNGADVVSCSFFSDQVLPSEEDAVEYATANGVLIIAAAGNSSSVIPYYPGAYESVLGVAAFQNNGGKAGFSNWGSWVDVSAPGTNLTTSTNSGGYTTGFGGTSGATPQVAGLAALIKGMNPALNNLQIRGFIEDSATLVSQAPFGEYSNYGKIDCLAAVQAALGGTPPAKPTVVRWAMPLGRANMIVRVYGRGFDKPSIVALHNNGSPLSVTRKRNYLDVRYVGSQTQYIDVMDGSTLLVRLPIGFDARSWTPAEGSSPGASVTGGFVDAFAQDGQFMSATRRTDSRIILDLVFKGFDRPRGTSVFLTRKYAGSAVGTETVYLYDWSSGSYPYGNWVPIGTVAINGGVQSTRYFVSSSLPYTDVNGNMYMRIQSSNDQPSGTVLQLDFAKLAH